MLRSIFSAVVPSSVIDLTSSEVKEESTSSSSPARRTRQLSAHPSLALSTSNSSFGSTVEVIEPDTVDVGRDSIDSQPSSRRSDRKRKATTVTIGGYAIKTQNLYSVTADSYVYGDYQADAPKAKKPWTKSSLKPSGVKKNLSEPEQKRMAFNAGVKARVEKNADIRKAFFANHVKTFSPFLEESVDSSLRQFAKKNPSLVKAANEMNTETFMQPDLIQAEMRDYQLIGLNWMVKMHKQNLACILGDEMGLGKTLQTISLLCHLKETEKISGPSLVICPLTVLYSWCNELEKWAPGLKFLRFHSSSLEEREIQKEKFKLDASSYDVVITTYEMVKVPSLTGLWRRQYFNYVILDEGHIIKERKTQISSAVRMLHYENALILTGTPLQNNLTELWAILNFLYPEIFTISEPFDSAFDIAKKMVDKKKLDMAHALLDTLMIRRLKENVERLMPKKIETKVICPLSKTQIFWYKGLLLKDINSLITTGNEPLPASKRAKLNFLVMQLRKCCNHPFQFDGAEVDIDNTSLKDLIAASGKLSVLDMLLTSLFKKGHRTVLFSQFTYTLDIIEDYCIMRGWRYCRFDGSTARAKRNCVINQFNAEGSDRFIFLMSTRSGGMGLNLQTADTCILYDSDWNPQPDIQAMARVHRIGQKKVVHVYRLISGGTLEERMFERAQKKLYLDHVVNRGDTTEEDASASGLSGSELLASITFGCNAVFGDSANDLNVLPSWDDIDAITDRSRHEGDSVGLLKGGAARKVSEFDATEEMTPNQLFGGVDFAAIKEAAKIDKKLKIPKGTRAIASMWLDEVSVQEGKRERKSRLVMVDGMGSGYGKKSVPILASNNYELNAGESSVFQRELKGQYASGPPVAVKKDVQTWKHQNFCQMCYGTGDLVKCTKCPISLHTRCCEGLPESFPRTLPNIKTTSLCCSHHRCTKCTKSLSSSGGVLYSCQSCPNSFCEDCLPSDGVRMLYSCPRFEDLGFHSLQNAYIHCSKRCEKIATKKLGWNLKNSKNLKCPPEIDVQFAFGHQTNATL